MNDLKLKHDTNGLHAFLNGKRTTFGMSTVLKPDASQTDDDIKEQIKIILTLQEGLNRFSMPIYKIDDFKPININEILNDYTPFYKYTSHAIFENYIRKGRWQLGTIHQYQTIENQKQRDEFEGYCFMNMVINGQLTSSLVSTGYNYLIFCGTKKSNSALHKGSFGEKELYFPNVRSFADSIKKSIGARRYYIQEIEYNTSKWFNVKDPIIDDKLDLQNIIGAGYIELLNKYSLYPSLFVKPEVFSEEKEVRIVFEMDKDYYKPLKFENKSLLNYIRC